MLPSAPGLEPLSKVIDLASRRSSPEEDPVLRRLLKALLLQTDYSMRLLYILYLTALRRNLSH